jgi:hypothetical protein
LYQYFLPYFIPWFGAQMSCDLAESFLKLGYKEDKEEVIRIFYLPHSKKPTTEAT